MSTATLYYPGEEEKTVRLLKFYTNIMGLLVFPFFGHYSFWGLCARAYEFPATLYVFHAKTYLLYFIVNF